MSAVGHLGSDCAPHKKGKKQKQKKDEGGREISNEMGDHQSHQNMCDVWLK